MSWRVAGLIGVGAVAAALGIYAPALHGAMISDDLFLLTLPELQSLSWANFLAILDPTGHVAQTYVNYSPVHAAAHALQISTLGPDPVGHHTVNVVVHALNACLLLALFRTTGIGMGAALLGAAFFLVHPANVEAVAWISQLKTTFATTLALVALLMHPRRPVWGAVFFGLALLCKAHAVFALPVLAAFEWSGVRRREEPARWRWVGVWSALLVAFAVLEVPLFLAGGHNDLHGLQGEPGVHARTVVAIAARYLVMAATGQGVSALHEPPLAVSLTDPWWIAGVVALVVLAVRTAATLRARKVEAAYWVWAAAAFAPVSQLFPFINMMGDRYLYFILPGLIGGGLCLAAVGLERVRSPERRLLAKQVAAAAALGAIVWMGIASHQRASVWRNETTYLVDAAVHYPNGVTALVLRAKGAARNGDVETVVASLLAAHERGWQYVGAAFRDPLFHPLRNDPRFLEMARVITADLLEEVRSRPEPTATDLETLAQIHLWRGESEAAVEAIERALPLAGPERARLEQSLRALRAGMRKPAGGAQDGA